MYSSTGINFLPVDFKTCQKSRKNNIFNNLEVLLFKKKNSHGQNNVCCLNFFEDIVFS